MPNILKSITRYEYWILALIFLLFIGLRLPAIQRPYHQDEYKWPMYAYNIGYEPGSVPHPPLTEFIYNMTGKVFTPDTFRLTPFLFSIVNLGLLFVFLRRRWGAGTALFGSFLFATSFYGVLASLTVDTDGAVLPFFFLIALCLYDRLGEGSRKKQYIVWALFLLSLFFGLMVKMSFVLPIGAFLIDFLITHRAWFKDTKKRLYVVYGLLGGIVLFALALIISQYVFPGFSIAKLTKYSESFVHGFGSRNFFQTAIQFFKALLYLSPAYVFGLFLGLSFAKRELRLFYIYIALSLVFYLVLFDFSIGALDRYLAFLVVPTVAICTYLSRIYMSRVEKLDRTYLGLGVLLICGIALLQFLPHEVFSLHPKALWLSRLTSLRWDFLYPFFGGSGPLGFYISFLFIGYMWILGALLTLLSLVHSPLQKTCFVLLLVMGLVYNLAFTNEYLFGTLYGSSPRAVFAATEFIKSNSEIEKVLVYNDNGGWNIREIGKYERRIYADPAFIESYKEVFKNFSGHLLYIDMPKVEPGSMYDTYIQSCRPIYETTDKYISTSILDCRK